MTSEAIDALLADFRAWLQSPLSVGERADGADADGPKFDVATVLQQFIALRQEVNLQTRASRGQLEQNAQTIVMLQESLGTLQRQQHQFEDADHAAQDELVRPLLKTLIDAHDALSLAERQVCRLLDAWAGLATRPTDPVEAPPVIKLKIPHWARWLGLDASIEAQLAPLYAWRQSQQPAADPTAERYRQSVDALLTGYRMSLQRIERALEQQGLEVIACVGEPFDPEVMEVAEVVREQGRASTEVIEEIRRGYLWRGKLFRYAQVRVAKP